MVKTCRLQVSTRGEGHTLDLTPEVADAVGQSGLRDGTYTVFCPGSTGGITTIEFEDGVVHDLQACFERIAPQGMTYRHELRWHDGNGHSHVRAALLGPSLVVPFAGGKLLLGTWQQIVFVDFDNRARRREIVLQFMGE